ncbi:hypothetical protein [Porphyrobacter sp. ULC335]|uniref:hypothetical protein n=1 Tax=Porphyrobacter sp. ULC335 TaxID=2854260 RepID=UPI002220C352|nr:hypothetical protein [Porphyrobacter sp. ULC335]UYV15883.1 hypothetical protein KVF90_00570 [Porphyrobacter sp. ULC335]
MIAGLMLLFGGLGTVGIAIWQARRATRSRLLKTTSIIEGWFYGVGGVLVALLGVAILIEQIG